MRCIDPCANAHLNVCGPVRKVLDGQVGNAGDRRSLLARALLISSHHMAVVLLATHHPLIPLLATHHSIGIAIPYEPALCQRHSTNCATNRQQS